MSMNQVALLILLAVMLVLFSLDRFRIEIVAIAGLLAGYALGFYPVTGVFAGFANPAVITVIEILMIVQVLARARLFAVVAERLATASMGRFRAIAGLSAMTAFISVFMNNIGAFAIALPVALRLSDTTSIPRRHLLMPISFAALLGGLVSLIGTPANLLVSDALAKSTGAGFHFFDFAFVGLPVAAFGILIAAYAVPRLLPGEGSARRIANAGRRIVTERKVPVGSPLAGRRLADLPSEFGIAPHALFRDGSLLGAKERAVVKENDVLLLESTGPIIDSLAAAGMLLSQRLGPESSDLIRTEAVVMPESTLVGSRIRSLDVFHSRGIAVTGLSHRAARVEGGFADQRLSIGDILQIEGTREAIAEALEECECLPLAPTVPRQPLTLLSWRPVAIFVAGVAASAFGLLTPDIAFACVVLALAIFGHLNIRQAMADLDWPIIIMLAAMIPLGTAVGTTGTAAALADWLSLHFPVSEPMVGIAVLLLLAMAITPFVNNATVAIILIPIAFELARTAGHSPGAYLIAVAAGASLDFLTPFGHHNNTLAMGIGGYRFSDFLRAGWPLAVFGYILTLLLIDLCWL
ncbi:SLC13 family permease [Rhizobium sp. BK251]|uniref:SLC13 family permease n=1 Tax=Rhizobium sp. BK251 TaxID=2512125 RepID=UPI00104D81AB|nr:SLC13 family permease [Rhizobium sp. BK251]TCL69871.1 di/tricarboxylate transporter [Rhizobium sp. BK251]